MSIRPRKRVETTVSQAQAYDTIIRPVITEKASMSSPISGRKQGIQATIMKT